MFPLARVEEAQAALVALEREGEGEEAECLWARPARDRRQYESAREKESGTHTTRSALVSPTPKRRISSSQAAAISSLSAFVTVSSSTFTFFPPSSSTLIPGGGVEAAEGEKRFASAPEAVSFERSERSMPDDPAAAGAGAAGWRRLAYAAEAAGWTEGERTDGAGGTGLALGLCACGGANAASCPRI